MEFDDFRLLLARRADSSYEVFAFGPTGAATEVASLTLTEEDIEQFLRDTRVAQYGEDRRNDPSGGRARELGQWLFDFLFVGKVRERWRTAVERMHHTDKGLRVMLQMESTPELVGLPWEWLYDEPFFLALRRTTPIVRSLDTMRPYDTIRVQPPLRLLGMVSDAGDDRLDVEREKRNLEAALAELENERLVQLDWLPDGRFSTLQQALATSDYHIFHYVGHGDYDETTGSGGLLFEDCPSGVSGQDLAAILADRGLRLVFLNSCEAARSSRRDGASVAATLARHQIPAVIGMQFEISDGAAITFSRELYRLLAGGLGVEEALLGARQAVHASPDFAEWATPTLFMGVANSRLLELVRPGGEVLTQARGPSQVGELEQALAHPSHPVRVAAATDIARVLEDADPELLAATKEMLERLAGHRRTEAREAAQALLAEGAPPVPAEPAVATPHPGPPATAGPAAATAAEAEGLAAQGERYRQAGRLKEALTDLEQAVALDPANRFARNARGDVYRRLGRLKDAMADFDAVLEVDPENLFALRTRALIYQSLGRRKDELRDIRRASAVANRTKIPADRVTPGLGWRGHG